MNLRTPDDATLRAWDLAHLWHPFTPQAAWAEATPLIIERGEGVYLEDTEGRRYLDGVSSLWCNVHGHRHPKLDAALRDQIDRIAHTTMLGLTHPGAIRLAKELVERTPEGLNRVFFSDDGATAVEVALKMAYQYWRQKADPEPARTLFLSLADAYHGDTLGDVSVGGVERFHAMFGDILFPGLRAPSPNCYRCPLGQVRETCGLACLSEMGKLLRENRGRVAAVVIEPTVQCAAGMIVQPEGYLKGVERLCREHDTLLIADEVAVGFGRTGTLFACDQEQVRPDFLCMAKGITGGYLPLAATLTTDRISSAFYGNAADGKTFYHGHTYGGNPLGAAVALANLAIFDDERTLETLVPKIEHLAARLEEVARLEHVGDVRRKGFLAGIELVLDRATRERYPFPDQVGARVCRLAREKGVLLRPLGDVLVVMLPLAAEVEHVDLLIDTLIDCVRQITELDRS
jgi:adenosylmethionine-8-amino-7-oxononanoate aminotransferase